MSRFKWGLSAELQLPDFETRISILKNKLYRDGVEINQDMVNNMEKILSNFLVQLNENASEELSPEEANIVESELKRLGYM